MNRKKKIVILLYIYLVFLFSPKANSEENYNIEILKESNIEYVNYSNGRVVFITSNSYYEEKENTIYVIDSRNSEDSNIKIIDSYKIKSKSEMEEIIKILLEYEKENPSNWNRTYESMLNEWQIHNISYNLHYDEESSKHVDLNNEDENKYNSRILSRLLGNK